MQVGVVRREAGVSPQVSSPVVQHAEVWVQQAMLTLRRTSGQNCKRHNMVSDTGKGNEQSNIHAHKHIRIYLN